MRLKREDLTSMISIDELVFISGELSIDDISFGDHEGEDAIFLEDE